MEILDVEVEKLVHFSMAKNTWKTYKTALESLAKFSKEYGLNVSWPIQIDVLTRFIAYLSYSGLTSSTINTYLSRISHKHNLLGVTDTTCTFIVSKMLEGVRRKSPKLSDIRAPVTLEILHKIVRSLPSVCSSHYESCLFASAFSLACFALLRIGELTADTNTDIGAHTIFINDLSLKFSNSKYELHLKICSSKADQRVEENLRCYQPPQILIIHLGSNDLGLIKGKELIEQIRLDIIRLHVLLPNLFLVWSEILPRRYWHLAENQVAINSTRKRVNAAVRNIFKEELNHGLVICHPNIKVQERNLFRHDGVHLSDIGNDVFLNNVQGALESFASSDRRVFPN
ncbi:Hypothetical predicted protein [Mytilus galloprovincialis]|uniref:Core-binding (CB) domain-containing protein n=1 Tax=Mytilus galloprovincialis TaxID=29158 RepID=A0A8B6E9M1_MYTGA|nr:Hypothetical predicted protein [Mytilus galloprovincialis]